MYPDFIEDGVRDFQDLDDGHSPHQVHTGILSPDDVTELFKAPEAVASAWESCLKIASQMG
jgi:hypothetical protein